jgi:CheY-like chemotaxis protein/signal recognition particle receptor subunit beta
MLPRRILIVDDDAFIRRPLEFILRQEGYEPAIAADASEGMRAVESALPDLIFLDVMMPGKDGLTWCAELKSDPRYRGIPIVLLSARGQDHEREEALAAGRGGFHDQALFTARAQAPRARAPGPRLGGRLVAQWSLAERTLYAKLVYYGPALGGKTTNLKVLHNVTDPDGQGKLVSLNTANDRTLFFDLLPFDLGSLLGYKVALKLYTVPGQVRYDATRRAVLAGADAVVFVADSDPAREKDNRQSWQDLTQNMRVTRLDPAKVPILVQLNKRDLAGVVTEETMRAWFGVTPALCNPAIARDGTGVLDTFMAASHAMIERLVSMAEPQTRRTLDAGNLAAQLDAAFAPFLARSAVAGPPSETAGDGKRADRS